jgi:hypothetical protein
MMSDYYGDVSYEVWRSGHSPDDIDRDRVREYQSDGYRPDEAAHAMVRSWEQARQRRLEAQQEEEAYYAQQPYPEQEYPEQPYAPDINAPTERVLSPRCRKN